MYFNNQTTLWCELDMLLPSDSCVCDAGRVYYEREWQQRMIQFLVGLRGEFEQARHQILLIEPLHNVEKAYSMIIQVEDRLRLQFDRGEREHRMAIQVGRQLPYRPHSTNYEHKWGFRRRLTKEERRRLKCAHC